ncbi:YdeI/OmpD-associated family protein [Nocardia sp. NPDC057227]|uniref:YdeI/OmpD-associated family protein n=1 Tax=Nocardia sp. NPDC057227 TaxID=3346056 RepID=UPI00362DF26D
MAETFTTRVELDGKTATGLPVPDEVVEALGGGKRPKISVTIGGHTYASSIAVRGGGYKIPLSSANRAAAGIAAGDAVEVTIELDTAERTVEIPEELAAAFAENPAARAAFDALSYSKQRQRAEPVAAAKQQETRDRRVAAIIAELSGGG